MFAFPAMYPAGFFRATAWPLLGVIALTLVWASGSLAGIRATDWLLLVANAAAFSWLAVRIHREVLIEPEDAARTPANRLLPLALRYLAALATGAVLRFAFFVGLLGAFSLLSLLFSRYIPGPTSTLPADGQPDPGIQRLIDYGVIVVQAPVAYLLARCSTVLPALALGHEWSPGSAWKQTQGNGWRLVLVVFLLPWALGEAIDQVYAATGSALLVALLAILRSIILALGVIALSLSYRELPAWPAPPPTTPPA